MPKLGRRSEPQHIDYMYPNYSVTRNAPFGTFDTPVQKPKIVGSKLVFTREDGDFGTPSWAQSTHQSRTNSPQRSHSRSSQIKTPIRLAPLSEKPTNFNPNALIQQAKNAYNNAHQDIHQSNARDGFTSPQLNRHGVIPPISTPSTASHYRQQQSPPANNGYRTSDQWQNAEYNVKYNLAKYLPPDGSYLPKEPLVLSKDEELELRRLVREDLSGFNMSKLKDIYLELTGFDRHLTGCVSFDNLLFSLLRGKVGISSDNLRLVASLFISPDCNSDNHGDSRMVNYEKVLSFISAAQKPVGPLVADMRETPILQTPSKNISPLATPAVNTKSGADKTTKYNPITQEDHSPRSKKFPYGNGDNSKLLRMIEQALVNSGEELDYDKIYNTFRNFDRGHRDMLSRDQIKMLAMKCRIPLQESIMDKIINKLDSSNGQYSWMQFLEFLERVQPANTGLRLPESKRPADYARHYPEPSPDWPELSPKTTDNGLNKAAQRDSYQNHDSQPSQVRHAQSNDNEDGEYQKSRESEIRHQETRGQYGGPAQQQQQLQQQHQQQQQGLEPWFDRFMKLAKALYDNDVDVNGYLSVDEVNRLIRLHNETLDLGFDEDTVRRTVQQCAVNENNVPIDGLLKILSVHHS